MIKRSFILLLILVNLLSFLQAEKIIDGVVWIVGDQAILRSEVEQERIRAQYQGTKIEGNPYCRIPEQIAIQKLFLHQAEIDSIEANPAQVEMQVNAQVNFYLRQIGSKEKLEEYFKKSLSEIKNELRQTVTDQSIVQQVRSSLIKDIKVTPSEIRHYYSQLPEDSITTVPATVKVQILTLEPSIPMDEIEATKEKLRGFSKRVNKGDANFAMLAQLYSDDKESAKRGGELGFMSRASLVKPFADAAFDLHSPGEVSRVIKSEFGYHIIQLIERRDDRVNCRHILLHPRVSIEIKEKTLSQLDSIANQVRTKIVSFAEATTYYSADKDTRLNEGLMTNKKTGSTYFEYQDLPTEVAKQVYDMKEGQISTSFMMYNPKLGRNVYAIVKVQKKLDSHKANLDYDYQMLKKECEASKRETVVNDWIKNKIKDTYIFITPEWRDCEYKYDGWLQDEK